MNEDPLYNKGSSPKKGLTRIIYAAGYSISGFKAAFQNEAAFRQILCLNIILIPITFFLDVSAVEQAVMIGVKVLILIPNR